MRASSMSFWMARILGLSEFRMLMTLWMVLFIITFLIVLDYGFCMTTASWMSYLCIVPARELIVDIDSASVSIFLTFIARVIVCHPDFLKLHAGGLRFLISRKRALPVRHRHFGIGNQR